MMSNYFKIFLIGYRIMICLLPCCVYSHYHCPLCGSTFQRKCDLQIHVTRRCKGPARKRKRKSGTIDQNLVEMYSSGENLSVSYLKRVNADEADGILSMCAVNTRLIDVSQVRLILPGPCCKYLVACLTCVNGKQKG